MTNNKTNVLQETRPPNSFNVACATPEAKQQPEQLCLPWKVKVPLLVGTNHKDFTQIVIIHQAGYF